MVDIRKKSAGFVIMGTHRKTSGKRVGNVGRQWVGGVSNMPYICLIYTLSMLYLYYIYALSMLYLCFIYVSCIEHVCIIYVLSMKQQRSNGRADVPQGGKSAENGLMEGWREWRGWRGWRDGGKVCKGDFFRKAKEIIGGAFQSAFIIFKRSIVR